MTLWPLLILPALMLIAFVIMVACGFVNEVRDFTRDRSHSLKTKAKQKEAKR